MPAQPRQRREALHVAPDAALRLTSSLPAADEAVTKLEGSEHWRDETCLSRFAAIGESPAIHRGEGVGGKLKSPLQRTTGVSYNL